MAQGDDLSPAWLKLAPEHGKSGKLSARIAAPEKVSRLPN